MPTAPPITLAYYFGDDGYSIDQAALAVATRAAGPDEPPLERWRATGLGTSAAVIGERVATGALFGGGTLAIVADPGPLIKAKANRAELIATLAMVASGNALVFTDTLERWPKDGRVTGDRAELAAAIEAAGGEVRGFAAPKEGGLARWIEDRARERQMTLERGAAQALAQRVGGFVKEGDVDRRRQGQLAVQELDKLALYRPDGPISADDVQALVAEAIPASTWALLDLVGLRRAHDAADLLERVLDVTAEPIVLGQLHRRLRELLEVADLVASGTRTNELPRILRIHSFRAEQLARQAAGWTPAELEDALDGLLMLDAMVKGAGRPNIGEPTRRLAFTTWLATRVAPAARVPA